MYIKLMFGFIIKGRQNIKKKFKKQKKLTLTFKRSWHVIFNCEVK